MNLLKYLPAALFMLAGCTADNTSEIKIEQKQEHSVISELETFHDISSLPVYMDGSYCAQVSSWDTTGGNDDGFSGRYSWLRKNDDGSLVIFDVRGAGVINRIWTPTPNNDSLDFYIDNNLKPAFTISFADLFSGKVFPFIPPLCANQLGGYYCYMPITFSESCKIVMKGNKIQFHQIQYRLYNDGIKVKPFSIVPSEEEKQMLRNIADLWSMEKPGAKDIFKDEMQNISADYEIVSGKAVRIFDISSGGRIKGIEIEPASVFEGLYKNCDIKITWDNEDLPAVYCPVADFFGFAYGAPSMKSIFHGSDGNKMYSYFPMPFDKNATIELIAGGSEKPGAGNKKIKVNIWYTNEKRNPAREGKFYAVRSRENPVPHGKPHVFADIKGKGHYVGTILQAQGLKAGMTLFFEGDDSTSVDGSFRMHGTGSEDYFNGGWYALMDKWDGKMSLPLHGSLDYSLPFCRTGGYRLFLSDKISFEKSLYHSIEHGPVGNAFPADYTSLGFYYSDTPPAINTMPSEETRKVFIPDTLYLYPQLLNLTLYGSMNIETTWKYGTGGETYTFTPKGDSWVRISLSEIPEGSYKMYFDIMAEPFGCEFSLWQRQTQLSDWLSAFSQKEERNFSLYTCDINITRLKNTVTARFRTDKTKISVLLNRIILIRK